MKLFLYDEKHESVIDELDLGNLDAATTAMFEQVIGFLDWNKVTGRYRRLVVADRYRVEYEDDFASVVFEVS
jgi:hypothetical protein